MIINTHLGLVLKKLPCYCGTLTGVRIIPRLAVIDSPLFLQTWSAISSSFSSFLVLYAEGEGMNTAKINCYNVSNYCLFGWRKRSHTLLSWKHNKTFLKSFYSRMRKLSVSSTAPFERLECRWMTTASVFILGFNDEVYDSGRNENPMMFDWYMWKCKLKYSQQYRNSYTQEYWIDFVRSAFVNIRQFRSRDTF